MIFNLGFNPCVNRVGYPLDVGLEPFPGPFGKSVTPALGALLKRRLR